MASKRRREGIVDAGLDHAAPILDFAESALQFAPLPGLSLIAKGLKVLVERIQASRVNVKTCRGFLGKAAELANVLGDVMMKIKEMEDQHSSEAEAQTTGIVTSRELQQRLDRLSSTITEIRESAIRLKGGPGFGGACVGVFFSKRNEETLKDMEDALADALEVFKLREGVSIQMIVTDIVRDTKIIRKELEEASRARKEAEQQQIIDSIQRAAAGYRSVTDLKSEFLEGTREELFKELMLWAGGTFPENNPKRFYWLSGGAGMGKSSISYQLCKILDAAEPSTLGASFFFVRDSGDLASSRLFSPTLAHQVALSQPHLRSYMVDAIREHCKRGTNQLTEYAFEDLLQTPLVRAVVPPSSRQRTVIVIDGLDECQDREVVPKILGSLLELVVKIPWLYIFVASRPDPHIATTLANRVEVYHRNLNDTAVEWAGDVEHYLHETIPSIPGYGEYIRRNPKSLAKLVERAEGLFIYARVVVQFLDTFHDHPEEQFALLLRLHPNQSSLDVLYLQILESAYPSSQFSLDDMEPRRERLRIILGVIACWPSISFRGVWPTIIAAFFHSYLALEDVVQGFDRLRSFLCIDSTGRIRTLHASVRDFLLDHQRCTTHVYHVNKAAWRPRIWRILLQIYTFEGWNDSCKHLRGSEIQELYEDIQFLWRKDRDDVFLEGKQLLTGVDPNIIRDLAQRLPSFVRGSLHGRFTAEYPTFDIISRWHNTTSAWILRFISQLDSMSIIVTVDDPRACFNQLERHYVRTDRDGRGWVYPSLPSSKYEAFCKYSAGWWRIKLDRKGWRSISDSDHNLPQTLRPQWVTEEVWQEELNDYHAMHEELAERIKTEGVEKYWYYWGRGQRLAKG